MRRKRPRPPLGIIITLCAAFTMSCAPRNCVESGMPKPPPGETATDAGRTVRPAKRGFVVARGAHLFLDGERYRFVGVNMYSLPALPGAQKGYHCGNGFTDDEVRAALREVAAMGGRVVRIPAYQSATRGATDFDRLDFIVDTAEALGIKVAFVLENQWEHCTQGGYKYAGWYRGKYRKPYGSYKLSYVEYVKRVLTRYKDRPGILMWQLMNEAETVTTSDVSDPEAVLDFTRTMAGVARRADPNHLISLGTEGVLKPSSGGPIYALLHAIPDIDVVEAHDYADPWIGLPTDIHMARVTATELAKPFFIGEVGVSSPPYTRAQRAHIIGHKLQAAWEEDIDGVLLWSYRSIDGTKKHFGPKDPLVKVLQAFAASHGVLPLPPE
jgi:endo-1,4-beta-mannosidase